MDPLSQPSLLFDRHSSQTSPQWEEEEFYWRCRSADVRCFSDARAFHSHVFLNFGVGTKKDDSFVPFVNTDVVLVPFFLFFNTVLILHAVE